MLTFCHPPTPAARNFYCFRHIMKKFMTSKYYDSLFLKVLLREWHRKKSRMLLFARRTKILDILQDFISREGYSFYRLEGSTSVQKRRQLQKDFNNGNTFVFLISTGIFFK